MLYVLLAVNMRVPWSHVRPNVTFDSYLTELTNTIFV
jgi:hypothetical protein